MISRLLFCYSPWPLCWDASQPPPPGPKTARSIKTFSSEDAPVSLGVIFDMSGSMSSKIERAREAVVEFFKTANPQDEFFMITFADKPEEIADFTQSVEEIQGKLVYTVPKG